MSVPKEGLNPPKAKYRRMEEEHERIEAQLLPGENPLKLKFKISKSPIRKIADVGWSSLKKSSLGSSTMSTFCKAKPPDPDLPRRRSSEDRNIFSELEKVRTSSALVFPSDLDSGGTLLTSTSNLTVEGPAVTQGEHCYESNLQPSPKDSGIDICSPVRTCEEVINGVLGAHNATEDIGVATDTDQPMSVEQPSKTEPCESPPLRFGVSIPYPSLSPQTSGTFPQELSDDTDLNSNSKPASICNRKDSVGSQKSDNAAENFHMDTVDSGNESGPETMFAAAASQEPVGQDEYDEKGGDEVAYFATEESVQAPAAAPVEDFTCDAYADPLQMEPNLDVDPLHAEPNLEVDPLHMEQSLEETSQLIDDELDDSQQSEQSALHIPVKEESSSVELENDCTLAALNLSMSQKSLESLATEQNSGFASRQGSLGCMNALEVSPMKRLVDPDEDLEDFLEMKDIGMSEESSMDSFSPLSCKNESLTEDSPVKRDDKELLTEDSPVKRDDEELFGHCLGGSSECSQEQSGKTASNTSSFLDVFAKFVQQTSEPDAVKKTEQTDGSESEEESSSSLRGASANRTQQSRRLSLMHRKQQSNLNSKNQVHTQSKQKPSLLGCRYDHKRSKVINLSSPEPESSKSKRKFKDRNRGTAGRPFVVDDSDTSNPAEDTRLPEPHAEQERCSITCDCCSFPLTENDTNLNIKRFTTSQQKVVRLKRKVLKLCRTLFPDLDYPTKSSRAATVIDVLLDQILSVLEAQHPASRCSHLQVIPTQVAQNMDLRIVLCKSPVGCLHHLRRRVCRLLETVLPALALGHKFDRTGPQVDELLQEVILSNSEAS